jgi:hypothetical protein
MIIQENCNLRTVLDLHKENCFFQADYKKPLNFTSIDLAELDPGLYLVKIISDDKILNQK